MNYEHIIRLRESRIDAVARVLADQLNGIRDLLLISSQDADAFEEVKANIDFEEIAIVALLEPYEAVLRELGLNACDYNCESGDDDHLEVTFSFDTAEQVAAFEKAVRAANLP
ncbi:hypothetical protein [Methylobacterium isbiliense]|uniref:hypothetical protein n=1 Tax=Methylobacterium isbiliense TaxID=315478 RepID=UPI001EE2DDBD|nr:hypothetical protein [Methylobacterium isbiliense]MDN3625863.1 hypothetical protein [Methylobacterium isbiliense]